MPQRAPELRDRYDTLVIGAGMSGLSAGIRLAQAGQSVAVLERHSLWGGLNSFYKLRGRAHDVGLHALTNYVRPGVRAKPLLRALRQLRIAYADLRLGEQRESLIHFPEVRLRFGNGIELLQSEIARAFPEEVAAFARLQRDLERYPEPEAGDLGSARVQLAQYFRDPLLIEMLLTPLCWYGSPLEGDVTWSAFMVLFKSIYEEGFARPEGGVRRVLNLLRERLSSEGGELHLRCGVEAILSTHGQVQGVRLADGREVQAQRILSSAGWDETLALCPELQAEQAQHSTLAAPRLSFVESISILDRPLAALGHETTILFYNRTPLFQWKRPTQAVDFNTGVVCAPDNYQAPGAADTGTLRLTLLANHGIWTNLAEADYAATKRQVWQAAHAQLATIMPDVRAHVIDQDVFTPRTIERFTGHHGGAVYGSPIKHPSGRTPLCGLFICGTDQGMLGIVGAMLSGIAIANRHVLMEASST